MLSMSISLVAVFIPLLLMGGIVGRLFREFAVTLSVAIAVSMVVSLTTTPMMCAHLLKRAARSHGWLYRTSERAFNWRRVAVRTHAGARAAASALITLLVLLGTIGLNVYLFIHVPKGFFPAAGQRPLTGSIQADQDTSFQAMQRNLRQRSSRSCRRTRRWTASTALRAASAAEAAPQHGAHVHLLKPLEERKITADHDHRAAAAEAGHGSRARRFICRRRRICGWAAA